MRGMAAIALILIIGISSAWTNDAAPDLLKGRYEYVACDVAYAEDWLEMREGCALDAEVEVFDSSSYMEDLHEDLAELGDAADDADQLDFGLTMVKVAGDSLELVGALVKDALNGKNQGFFACVRDGEKPLMEDQKDCRADAMMSMKGAAEDYIGNEVDYAQSQVDQMDEMGADTSGMQDVVEAGHDLEDDVEGAFQSGDPQEVRKLHMRHSRLVLLFRMEQMKATIDYARPIIEAGSNGNKDEILDEGDELEADIDDLLAECEYDEDASSINAYAHQNADCWAEGFKLFNDFNSIRLLILEGA